MLKIVEAISRKQSETRVEQRAPEEMWSTEQLCFSEEARWEELCIATE